MNVYTYTLDAPTAQISLQFWLHHTVHCAENIVSECLHAGSLSEEMVIPLHHTAYCVSRKGGTGGGGWSHPQGDMHMVGARLG